MRSVRASSFSQIGEGNVALQLGRVVGFCPLMSWKPQTDEIK